MKRAAAIAIGLCALATAASAGAAATRTLGAQLTPQQVVTPKGKPAQLPSSLDRAHGRFAAVVDTQTHKLRWQLAWSGVGKPPLVVADIHIGQPGKFGPILLRLCGPCTSGEHGVTTLKRSVAQQLVAGQQWVTLITGEHPNGVLRGQIKVG